MSNKFEIDNPNAKPKAEPDRRSRSDKENKPNQHGADEDDEDDNGHGVSLF